MLSHCDLGLTEGKKIEKVQMRNRRTKKTSLLLAFSVIIFGITGCFYVLNPHLCSHLFLSFSSFFSAVDEFLTPARDV